MSRKSPAAPDKRDSGPGRYAYEGLDRVIHEKARLGILTSLATHKEGLSFGDLKELCSLTDGNLSRHLEVLAGAKLVEVEKGFAGRKPHTTCRLTSLGRRRFAEYISQLEAVVADSQSAARVAPRERTSAPPRRVARPGLEGAG